MVRVAAHAAHQLRPHREHLLGLVDYLAPECYVRHDSIGDQIASTKLMLRKSRQLAGRKPVYPVIWHRRQLASSRGPKWSKLHVQEYRELLQVCREHADGVIAYTSSSHTPADDAGAWTEMLAAYAKGETL